MLVDLGRNDLSRVSRRARCDVDALPRGRSATRTSRTSSRRSSASCATASTPFDLLRATFPAGTVSRRAEGARDADHLRARGLPARRRTRARSGYALPDGDARHVHRDPHDRPRTTASRACQAGAGIVADSDPARRARGVPAQARGARGGDRPRGGRAAMMLSLSTTTTRSRTTSRTCFERARRRGDRCCRNDAHAERERARADAPRRLARPRAGPPDAGVDRARRAARARADARRLPRPPGDRRGVRRRDRASASELAPRQGEPRRATTGAASSRGLPSRLRRRALPLARGDARAGRARGRRRRATTAR